jgi:hypothetical protein
MSVPGYVCGDFWRICDVCGFQYRASQTFKRWDGLITCSEDWEPRHPQDSVRGRKDNQNVPDPRPAPVNTIIGPLTTTVSAVAAAGSATFSVASSVRFLAADHIGVMLDGGDLHRAIIQSIPGATSITVTSALPGPVSIGAIVINYSAVSEADIG